MELGQLPWWVGGLLLGAVSVAHLVLTGRLLSVSGSFARCMRWRADESERADELALDRGDLDEALLAATLAQFGPDAAELIEPGDNAAASTPCGASPTVRLPVAAGALFLVFLAVGGALSASLSTGIAFEWSLGAGHERLIPAGWLQFALPILGGLLVGFGARMAGGCTSSHGLTGCARLQAGSLAATCAFFAGGTATSYLLGFLS